MPKTSNLPSPFGPVDSPQTARSMARLSAYGFGLASLVGVIQAAAVWYGADAAFEAYRGTTTGFAVVLALFTAGLALWQWRRPNRILPVFGLAWSLYELSAFVVSALVGGPLGAEGLPIWAPYVSMASTAICLMLHIGGLRGSAALVRFKA